MNPPTPVHWLPLEPDDDRIDALSSREKSALIRELLEVLAGHREQLRPEGSGASAGRDRRLEAGLAAMVTHAWRARAKMLDGATAEPREEMRRVYRHIESLFGVFEEMGLQLKEHTGDSFDYGSSLTVIATQPTAGLARERVTETLKPTIYWNGTIIQTGEVVIATPV